MDQQPLLPTHIRLANFRVAWNQLHEMTRRSILTRSNDLNELNSARRALTLYLSAAENDGNIFPNNELQTIRSNVEILLLELDQASENEHDPPDGELTVIATIRPEHGRGRPRIKIDDEWLQTALTINPSPTYIASVLGCSARTVRRAGLNAGILEPSPPVYTNMEDGNGQSYRLYHAQERQASDLDDAELDAMMVHILTVFPTFGRRLIKGYFQSIGIRVSKERIRAARERVARLPQLFGGRRIQRQIYSVAGLIRYKIVLHMFVDGYSRHVTAIQASNNNRAETVLQLFHTAVDSCGLPSRMRGDHGTENVQVAEYMEQARGSGRGSYIWGRSVHNTRVERLWYDVTHGFGGKWKRFFRDLELHAGLNPNLSAHIWLLHHLFLPYINTDAAEWKSSWNYHPLSLPRGACDTSPISLFFFGMVRHGHRGVLDINREEDVGDLDLYGVDWEALDDDQLMEHHFTENQAEFRNPFSLEGPSALSHVEVLPPNCPLTIEQVNILNNSLTQPPPGLERDMAWLHERWVDGLALCNGFPV